MGNSMNPAKNKGNSAAPKPFHQIYPQIPWTGFSLPKPVPECSQT